MQDVDPVRAEGRGERGEEVAHPVGVGRVPALGGVEQRGGRGEACARARTGRRRSAPTCAPSRDVSSTTPPASGRRTLPTTVAPTAANSGANASSRWAESWLPPIATTGMPASWRWTSVSTRIASASGPGARESYRSPATRTPSTRSSTRDPDDLVEDGRELVRPRPVADRPAEMPVRGVQEPDRHPLVGLERGERIATRRRGLLGPRRPAREREADLERGRDRRLLDDHRAGLEDRGPRAGHRRQEAVLASAAPRPCRAGRRPGTPSWR